MKGNVNDHVHSSKRSAASWAATPSMMSTQDTAIVIDDDDDKDADSDHVQLSGVDQICAILPSVTRSDAWAAIVKSGGNNVERALDLLLSRAVVASTATTAASTTTTSSEEEIGAENVNGDSSNERRRTNGAATRTTTTAVSLAGLKRQRPPDSFRQEESVPGDLHALSIPELSEEWHRCVSALPDGQFFVDSSFPPCPTSIDGRSRGTDTTATAKNPDDDAAPTTTAPTTRNEARVVRCRCGVPASAKTVQTDGPNYGRFYLACGQGRAARRVQRRQPGPSTQNYSTTTPSPTTPTSVPPVPCNFFQWDPHGSLGAANQEEDGYAKAAASPLHKLEWVRFHSALQGCHMVHPSGPSPDHVRQGRLGNCWFLSALAVVAERPDLIKRIVPRTQLNDKGCYQINLCLDGQWTPVLVDSYLPVVLDADNDGDPRTGRTKKGRSSDGIPLSNGKIAHGAFCGLVNKQLWPALVEKAYAKAHTCYRNLSGGFIAEALHDLTGAPTETTVFSKSVVTDDDKDELWARLVSFHEAGFVMGVATASGGDGLVGGHAYSILNVIEVHDSIVGEQRKVTDFFTASKSKPTSKDADSAHLDKSTSLTAHPIARKPKERSTIRLVRIRNPWGTREWKGAWSADSDHWTLALRKRLNGSWSKGDGTFFMSYDDMLERFHHLDVAKARTGWHFESTGGTFRLAGSAGVESSDSIFRIRARERTWAYLSIIQPKKRAHTTTRSYYCDPSFLLLKRRRDSSSDDSWICESAVLCGVQRVSTCEVFLDPTYLYACVPFSGLSVSKGPFPFRLTCYSASNVEMTTDPNVRAFSTTFVTSLHKELLAATRKVVHHVSESCVLVVTHGDGCLYFVAVNGSNDSVLSFRLVIEESSGTVLLLGRSDDTHFIAPASQKLLVSVSRTGGTSGASTLKFRYWSQTASSRTSGSQENRDNGAGIEVAGTSASAPISLAGDLLCQQFENVERSKKGSHSVDVAGWFPQIGASRGG